MSSENEFLGRNLINEKKWCTHGNNLNEPVDIQKVLHYVDRPKLILELFRIFKILVSEISKYFSRSGIPKRTKLVCVQDVSRVDIIPSPLGEIYTAYPVRPMTFQVFLKSSVSITKYPSTTPGCWALNLTVNSVSSFWRSDPSPGVTVNALGVSGVKAARKSAKPM